MSRRGRTCERTLGEFSTPASIERVTVGKLITRAEYYAWKFHRLSKKWPDISAIDLVALRAPEGQE